MRRRDVLSGLAAAPALVGSAWGRQAADVRRVGVLTPSQLQWDAEAFIGELRSLGHEPGRTLLLDVRSADHQLDRLPALAAALVAGKVEAIVAANTPAARAALDATTVVPILVGGIGDPALIGLASGLAPTGRNVTGVANMAAELVGKRLEVFKEAVPRIRRIVAHYHPEEVVSAPQMRSLDAAASRFGVEFRYDGVRTPADVEASLRRAADWPADGVLRLAGQGTALGGSLAELALRLRLPAMVLTAADVRAGGLLSYFADQAATWRRVAQLTHRVLAGVSVGDLPFEQPTKFDLAVNLRTAQAIGLAISPSILARADEVIE
jgi:putative tryptophan/tyrosine transport system substrate-binding protein